MMAVLSLALGGGMVSAAYADPPDPYQQGTDATQTPSQAQPQQPQAMPDQGQPQQQPGQTQPKAMPQQGKAQPKQQAQPQANRGPDMDKNNLTGNAKTGQYAAQDASEVSTVDVLFDFDSAALTADARGELTKLAQWAKCHAKGAIILEGHADPRGTQAYNVELSGARAAAVRQKLIDMGVPSDRIVVTVYGKNGPARATFAEDRRVTVRAATSPVQPSEITAQK
jgi:outer membrane protein OmpA-like peptidoglycan-associated protein